MAVFIGIAACSSAADNSLDKTARLEKKEPPSSSPLNSVPFITRDDALTVDAQARGVDAMLAPTSSPANLGTRENEPSVGRIPTGVCFGRGWASACRNETCVENFRSDLDLQRSRPARRRNRKRRRAATCGERVKRSEFQGTQLLPSRALHSAAFIGRRQLTG